MVAGMEKRDIAISGRDSTYAGNVVGYAIWERMGRLKAKKRTLRGSVNSMFGSSTVSPWSGPSPTNSNATTSTSFA